MRRSKKGEEIGEKILRALEAIAFDGKPFRGGDDVKKMASLIIELELEAYHIGFQDGVQSAKPFGQLGGRENC